MGRAYYQIDDAAARTAHDMNSFREFRSDEPVYRAAVDEVWELAEEKAEAIPELAEKAYGLADRFARKYAEWINDGYRIDSMCPSLMVSGGANFPTGRKRKQNQARDRHSERRVEIEEIKGRLRRLGTGGIQSDDPAAVEKLKAKAARLEERQDAMKAANRWWRKHGSLEGFECEVDGIVPEALGNMGLFGGAPFPSYALSNNLATIKRTRERIEGLEREKAATAPDRETEVNGEPCLVVEDTGIMRLQLVFDGKPDPETRDVLKRSGFRWSPRNQAWQRQLTDNARRALHSIEG